MQVNLMEYPLGDLSKKGIVLQNKLLLFFHLDALIWLLNFVSDPQNRLNLDVSWE